MAYGTTHKRARTHLGHYVPSKMHHLPPVNIQYTVPRGPGCYPLPDPRRIGQLPRGMPPLPQPEIEQNTGEVTVGPLSPATVICRMTRRQTRLTATPCRIGSLTENALFLSQMPSLARSARSMAPEAHKHVRWSRHHTIPPARQGDWVPQVSYRAGRASGVMTLCIPPL